MQVAVHEAGMGNFTFNYFLAEDGKHVCWTATGQNITINRVMLDNVRVTFERRKDGSLYNAYFSTYRNSQYNKISEAARGKLYNFVKDKGDEILGREAHNVTSALQSERYVKTKEALEFKAERLQKELNDTQVELLQLVLAGPHATV